MTRETRNNLIFVLLLIPLLLPGGIMLFRAKLDPEARRMFKPDFVRRDSVYINYDDQRPDVPRIVPPVTGQWIQIEGQRLVHPDLRQHMQWFKGIASENHRYEVVAMTSSAEEGSVLAVMVWDPKIQNPTFATQQGEPFSITHTFKIDVAPQIRKELQKAGFVQPPDAVQAYLIQSASQVDGHVLSAHFTSTAHTEPETENLQLPVLP